MKLTNIFLLIFAVFSTVNAQITSVKVPRGKPILIDSEITENEWADAETLVVETAKLHFKQSGEFVFIAIDAPNQESLTCDAYLSTGGEIYNLHVSAMLGERILKNGEFTSWDWWNNQGWTANASRILNTVEPKRFLPSQAIEFQISRRRFESAKWLMKFRFGYPNRVVFPKETDAKTTKNWLEVDLGKAKFK